MNLFCTERHRGSQAVFALCALLLLGSLAGYPVQSAAGGAIDPGCEPLFCDCGDTDDEAAGPAMPDHAVHIDGTGLPRGAATTCPEQQAQQRSCHFPRAPPCAAGTSTTPNPQ